MPRAATVDRRAACRIALGTWLCAAASAAHAAAQDPPAYRLGEVVISAATPISEAAGTVRVITAADLAERGARSLADALQLLPGISVRTGGEGVPRLDLRGFRSRHLILLLNGVPMNSTFDGQADPSLIPVEDIAFIKVIPGAGSVLYGQGTLGGIINVVTARGAGRGAALAGGAGEGDNRLGRLAVSLGNDRTTLLASGRLQATGDFPSVAGAPALGASARAARPNSDRDESHGFATMTLQASDALHLGLTASAVNAEYGIPPNLITDPNDEFASRPTFERIEDLDALSGHLAADYTPSGIVAARGWVFLNRLREHHNRYDDSTYSGMSDSTVRGSYRDRTTTNLTGAAVQISANGRSGGRFTLGLSAERDAWDDDLRIRDVPVGGGGGGGGVGGGGGGGATYYDVRTITSSRDLRRYGAALEYEVAVGKRAGVVAGYAHHWLDRDGGTDQADAGSLGLHYAMAARTELRASAARKFRFPTIRQLYDVDGGNPDLETERATMFEAGVRRSLPGRSSLDLAAFITSAEDFIERPNRGDPFANHDEYRFRGIEVTAETRALPRFLLRGQYSYLDADDRSAGRDRLTLQYRPRHRASAEGQYASSFGLGASLSVLAVTGQVYYSRVDPSVFRDLPDYVVVNARVSQAFLSKRLRIHAGVDNLLDERYEEEYGSPRPTRVFYGGLTLQAR